MIEAAEVAGFIRRAGDDLAVLDAREELAYTAGHVPGAVRVDPSDWKRLSLTDDEGLSNAEAWRRRIGALGIESDDAVLVYDDGAMTHAARVWFILQHFGVREIRVLNGGIPMLERAIRRVEAPGRLTRSTETVDPAPAGFDPPDEIDRGIGVIGTDRLRAAIDAGKVSVLDARTPREFRGEDQRDNQRGGHLPGAVNVPHERLLDERGRLKPADELAGILREAGFERGTPVVTHCQSGGRASLAALAAARAGFGPVVNYYLSFGAWSADSACTVIGP